MNEAKNKQVCNISNYTRKTQLEQKYKEKNLRLQRHKRQKMLQIHRKYEKKKRRNKDRYYEMISSMRKTKPTANASSNFRISSDSINNTEEHRKYICVDENFVGDNIGSFIKMNTLIWPKNLIDKGIDYQNEVIICMLKAFYDKCFKIVVTMNTTQHLCLICNNKTVKSRSSAESHLARLHCLMKPNKCDFLGCNKHFATVPIKHAHHYTIHGIRASFYKSMTLYDKNITKNKLMPYRGQFKFVAMDFNGKMKKFIRNDLIYWQCVSTNKIFRAQRDVWRYLHIMNNQQKHFSCLKCKKRFAQKIDFERHECRNQCQTRLH